MMQTEIQNLDPGLGTSAAIGFAGIPEPGASFVEDELQWRRKPPASASASARVFATRWRSLKPRTREVIAETPSDTHVVAVVLQNENVRFSVAGRIVHDGVATPGSFHVTEPAAPTRCLFRGSYDVIHLHVPNATIAEICRDLPRLGTRPLPRQTKLARDPTIERLARALLAAENIRGCYGRLYVDSVSIALVAQLLGFEAGEPRARPRVAELAKWRLRRAIEYIEASLAGSVSLADIATAAGLTRMHFAAQFKVATGLTPHEYLLRRRIERAQEALAGTSMSLVEVALSVGFQTQSHFTSVFKRVVGKPPRAWREMQDNPASCEFATGRARAEAARPTRSYLHQLAQPC